MTFVSNFFKYVPFIATYGFVTLFFVLIGFELKDFLHKNLEQSPVYSQPTNAKTSL